MCQRRSKVWILVSNEQFVPQGCCQIKLDYICYYYLFLSSQITSAMTTVVQQPASFSQCFICLDIYHPEILTCLRFFLTHTQASLPCFFFFLFHTALSAQSLSPSSPSPTKPPTQTLPPPGDFL